MARCHLWRNDVVRSYWRTRHPLLRFLCLHEAVTLPFVVAISDPTTTLAIIHLHFGDCLSGTLFSSRWSAMEFRRCIPPCVHFIAREDPHSKCILCLGFSHAREVVYGTSNCKICDDFRLITLRSRLEDYERESSNFSRRASSTSAPPREITASRELSSLLQKGAIEEVPQSEVEWGFFSRYFLVPKRDGGLRPILDLRRLNLSLYKGKFKMLTMRTIMSQVQEGDWFVTIDLKDAYFHIQVVHRHRRFLRFAFGGKAYQYKVLPFSLALAPRTFTKCMDAALAPLRLQGIRVLNYLDDWLILAHSRELVSRHRDIVLSHIHSLGLRMNAKKSVLLPSQRTVFLGVRLDSVQMQARLAPARIPVLTACLARFKLGHHVSVGTCRRLLGLMAAASPVLPLGLLHMRPFLWWMKELRLHPTVPATRLIRVSRSCCRHLLMWQDPVFLQSGVRMGAIHRRHMITTDASMTGWGTVFEGRPASGEWKEEFLFWHINCLELRAVFLALKYFLPVLGGYHIIVRMDNMAVVSHINRQGGSRLRTLDRLARHLLLWSQDKFLYLRAVHVPGVLNLAADFLLRQKLKPGEWMLNRQTVSQIWDLFGKAEVDLFASQESSQCPLWFSLNFPTTLGIDAFAHPWPNVSLYAFPPIKLIPAVLCRVKVSSARLLLIAPFWPSQTWFSENWRQSHTESTC